MSRTLEFNYKGVKERVLVFMLISISCLDLKASKLTHTIKKKSDTMQNRQSHKRLPLWLIRANFLSKYSHAK